MITKGSFRPARSGDISRIAGCLVEGGLFAAEMELADYIRRHPWGIHLHQRCPEETHAVLDVWREGTGTSIIRLFKSRPRDQRPFISYLLDVLVDEGFSDALSPGLLPSATRPFKKAGFVECERLLVLKKRSLLHVPTQKACELRRLAAGDAGGIAAIDEECFDDMWRFRIGDTQKMLASVNGFVAIQNGAAMGYTMVSTSREAGTVGRLAVRPEHRNRGVGSTLLAAGLDWLREAGAKEVTLCTQRGNLRSRRLYRSFGFEQLPEELWIMQKDL
ncbi:MAG: GNAT family N-acetyltransferase [Actinobacteria bacterium]|nr:MAG: GNAT family N-acetyltransferase [Actinomycetota bacterium]